MQISPESIKCMDANAFGDASTVKNKEKSGARNGIPKKIAFDEKANICRHRLAQNDVTNVYHLLQCVNPIIFTIAVDRRRRCCCWSASFESKTASEHKHTAIDIGN